MSRSVKNAPQRINPRRRDNETRPGTEKVGARRRAKVRPRNDAQETALRQRRVYGGTEKTLRRCRKLWTRAFAKAGRRDDQRAVEEGLDLPVEQLLEVGVGREQHGGASGLAGSDPEDHESGSAGRQK